tara:strand:+ start:727 stop:1374 length:648 start_codon:yes stop_codon:yes gene_type:complete
MSFAKLSIQEIQKLHENKVSALQMLVYSVIASHIYSNKRNNAYPSLRRIQSLLGGAKLTSIQSITRAITALVTKGLIEKGKVRSRKRFVLIHRPVIEIINSVFKGGKEFVSRFAPSKIMGAVNKISTNPRHSETKPVRQHKRDNQVKKSKLFFKRGRSLWSKVCPSGRSNKFDMSTISVREATQLINWVYETEQQWIIDTWPEQVKKLEGVKSYG